MNNLIQPISEENIFDNIEILKDMNINSVERFNIIKSNLPTTAFSSIHSNYLPLFIYDFIVHKPNLKDFENTIIHIYTQTNDNSNNLQYIFSRFFNHSDTNVSLKYFEQNLDSKQISIWDKLSYLFFSLKNDNKGLNNETLPYLEIMLKHVSDKNIAGLYGGNINSMMHSLYYNFEDTIPLLNVINNNPAYKIFNPPEHYDFLKHALYYMNYGAENVPNTVKQKVYNIYAQHLEGFKEAFEHELVHFNKNEKRFIIGYGVANYIFCIGEQQALDIFDKNYKQALIDFNDDKPFPDNTWRENNNQPLLSVPHYELAASFKIPFNNFLKSHEITTDSSKIDINKPLYYNFLHLKLLEKSIINHENPFVSIEARKYILESLQSTEDQYQFAAKLIDSNSFKTYFAYLALDEKLENKNDNNKKKKI